MPPIHALHADPAPLSTQTSGEAVVVARVVESEHACRLRELGLAEGRVVRVLSAADPMICLLDRARIALARRLAETIEVRRLAGAAQ